MPPAPFQWEGDAMKCLALALRVGPIVAIPSCRRVAVRWVHALALLLLGAAAQADPVAVPHAGLPLLLVAPTIVTPQVGKLPTQYLLK